MPNSSIIELTSDEFFSFITQVASLGNQTSGMRHELYSWTGLWFWFEEGAVNYVTAQDKPICSRYESTYSCTPLYYKLLPSFFVSGKVWAKDLIF